MLSLSLSDQEWVLNDPYCLSQLMIKTEIDFEQACSIGLFDYDDGVPAWPTQKYTALYERGRSIVAQDLEVWSDDILKTFGFKAK